MRLINVESTFIKRWFKNDNISETVLKVVEILLDNVEIRLTNVEMRLINIENGWNEVDQRWNKVDWRWNDGYHVDISFICLPGVGFCISVRYQYCMIYCRDYTYVWIVSTFIWCITQHWVINPITRKLLFLFHCFLRKLYPIATLQEKVS